mmetsp:Transcript_32650/g.88462  ORF Transcript_32650/g.88462 Transcript_32650/m.88462 type:complete len:123 (+) Transcript_32650:20-388(+)
MPVRAGARACARLRLRLRRARPLLSRSEQRRGSRHRGAVHSGGGLRGSAIHFEGCLRCPDNPAEHCSAACAYVCQDGAASLPKALAAEQLLLQIQGVWAADPLDAEGHEVVHAFAQARASRR